jgi:hypothetical protein
MSKGPAKFKQSDVARAIRAIVQTGAPMAVEISPDGTIRLVPSATTVTVRSSKVDKPKTLF